MMYDKEGENFRQIGEFILHRTDPFGFWVILDEKGKSVKEFLDHSYLSAKSAAQDLDVWLKSKESKKK